MNNRINVVQGGAANSISDPSGEELRYQFGICRFVFFKNLTRRALNVKISSLKKVSFRRAILPASIMAVMAMSGSANAFKIDTDNEDIDVRWDNTFRYNAGWRMSEQKWDLKGDASNAKFKNGKMVTNRLDILSEMDFIYKKDTGFRISGAGWYDARYNNDNLPNSNFVGDRYPDEVKRYYNGPSGEILDAFLFTKFDFGNVPVNVKLGQHTVYWGETLFSLGDGVSAGQSYADLRKALATPGVEAKEVFKPLNQLSFSAQISPELTVMGQYFFDYKADLFPLGGTYFSPAGFLTYQGGTVVAPAGPGALAGLVGAAPAVLCGAFGLPGAACAAAGTGPGGTLSAADLSFGSFTWDGIHQENLKKHQDWGLAAKWRPEWLDGTAGLYYREYTPKNGGALAVTGNFATFGPGYFVGAPTNLVAGIVSDPDAPQTRLLGFSLAKQVFGISWGMDLTYRKDATLLTKPFTIVGSDFGSARGWAPIGDIYTGTFNMIAYDGKRGIGDFNFYDSAVLLAEFDFDILDKVTRNKQNFGGRANCITGTSPLNAGDANQGYYGCSTSNSYGINVSFEPKWFQVFPGTDVTMPIYYGVGLHGNSSVPAVGQNEGMGAFSFGLTADVDAKYNFAVKYNGFLFKRKRDANSGNGISNAALGDFSDRNWLSFTAKATW